MSLPAALEQLARLYGIQLSYSDAAGQEIEAPAEAVLAVLQSLGAPIQNAEQADEVLQQDAHEVALIEPVLVAWNGQFPDIVLRNSDRPDSGTFTLTLEDGTRSSADRLIGMPRTLPFGYHELMVEVGSQRALALVISAPLRAHTGDRAGYMHDWGLFLPVYAMRSRAMQGIGDFTALGQLSNWAGELGAGFVGTLPLLATFLDQPFEASPYSPVSRLFWNEIYVDLNEALERFPCATAATLLGSPGFREQMARLNQQELVDYRECARLKHKVLSALADCFFAAERDSDAHFQGFVRDRPRVRDYAEFRAVCDRQQKGWPAWPEPLRSGQLTPGSFDPAVADYHVFAQYVAAAQLEALDHDAGPRLYLDLPLGVHPDGYDVWRERKLFATGVAVGAPPDGFFTQGQNWGFPPMSPTGLRSDRYGYMRETIRAHLRYAGALRLDHVMALHRLFWVPDGMEATDGVYVRYPAAELYAILCLESHRHRALIVGEDLGTVPPEVRESMDRHGLARMFVVQFELRDDQPDPLPAPPVTAVASLNTHDMPSFEGFRRGVDADLRGELRLLDQPEIEQIRHQRRELMQRIAGQLERAGFLHGPPEPETLRDALLEFMAASEARLLLVNLEDLWREDRPQNVPGTGAERPNWRRRTRPSLEEIMNSPELHAALTRLNQIRRQHQ